MNINKHADGYTLSRHKNGISLNTDTRNLKDPAHTTSEVFDIPVNCYILDKTSSFIDLNEQTAMSCGYQTRQNALGKSVKYISSKHYAECIASNDKAIMHSQQGTCFNETHIREADEKDIHALSIKYPLYINDRVCGIFGYSLIYDLHDISSISTQLATLFTNNILNLGIAPQHILRGKTINGVYFDHADMHILQCMIRGKTAKQIAQKVQLSHRTVEHRIERMKQRSKSSSKSELIDFVFDDVLQGS